MCHDRYPGFETAGEGCHRTARDPAASRLSEPADSGARRTAGDYDEGPEPGRRRSGPRLYHQELADRLAFERWGELDTLASRLAVQVQVIAALKHCGDGFVSPVAG